MKQQKQVGIIVECDEFKEGDIICHMNNFNNGFEMFFKASERDVRVYSGTNGTYLKLVFDNAVKPELHV